MKLSQRDRVAATLWAAGTVLLVAASVRRPSTTLPAMAATLQPFVTLAVVLAAAGVAERFGVFRWLAGHAIPRGGPPRLAFGAVLALTAALSALMNLDVAVVVATPLALRVARRRGLSARWLVLGVANTANAASILLPTSNLTNLLVLDRSAMPLSRYLRASWAPWIAVCAVTVGILVLACGRPATMERPEELDLSWRLRPALGDLAALFLAASAVRALLVGGVILRGGFWEQASTGGLLAAIANNLPAAAAFHPQSVTGLWAAVLAAAVGPNLVLTGSVASVICRRIARSGDSDLDPLAFSVAGLILVPLQLLAAYGGLRLVKVL